MTTRLVALPGGRGRSEGVSIAEMERGQRAHCSGAGHEGRIERIDELQRQYQCGTLSVDAQEVARHMLVRILEDSPSRPW